MRLGINIDHVATLRNARGGKHPSVMRAAELVKQAGVDLITIHLREDRRHIKDADAAELIQAAQLPINFEMAATPEMLEFALKHRPFAACIVPEKRAELTTEGGLDVAGQMSRLAGYCATLNNANIRSSLFVDPDLDQIKAASEAGATCIEIHTGSYAHHYPEHSQALAQIQQATAYAHQLGLEVHAGHGLTYENTPPIAAIAHIVELNIGHFLMGEALFVGLDHAIIQMKQIISEAAL